MLSYCKASLWGRTMNTGQWHMLMVQPTQQLPCQAKVGWESQRRSCCLGSTAKLSRWVEAQQFGPPLLCGGGSTSGGSASGGWCGSCIYYHEASKELYAVQASKSNF